MSDQSVPSPRQLLATIARDMASHGGIDTEEHFGWHDSAIHTLAEIVATLLPPEPEPERDPVPYKDYLPAEPTEVEQFSFLADWAARHRCQLDLEGECGIGRECVGMLRGNSYLDYGHIWDEDQDGAGEFFVPDDAYHKHPCMAVLGRGPAAVRQLYDWAKWLDDNGYEVDEVPRRPEGGVFGLLLHGVSVPRLVKRAAEAGAR